MSEFFDPKRFFPKTNVRDTLKHEVSSKRFYKVKFVSKSADTLKTKLILQSVHEENSETFKPESILSVKAKFRENIMASFKVSNKNPPSIGLKSNVPLLSSDLQTFIQLSPRYQKKTETIDALVGFKSESEKHKVMTGLLYQNNFSIIGKAGVQPFNNIFFKTFLHFNLTDWRIIDYSSLIGYKREKYEFFFQHLYDDRANNIRQVIKGITIGAWYKYDNKSNIAMYLTDTGRDDETVIKKKMVVGVSSKVTDSDVFKVKIDTAFNYSILYSRRMTDYARISLRKVGDLFDPIGDANRGFSLSVNVEI